MKKINYKTGNPLYGQTELELNEDGSYFIQSDVVVNRETKVFKGKVTSEIFLRCSQLMKNSELFNTRYEELSSSTDDSKSIIRLTEGQTERECAVWDRDQAKYPAFKTIQSLLSGFITEISNGIILENHS